MTQSCGRPHYLRNKETLVENKWTAKDGCLKSSADSLYESIPPSSSCSLATLDTFSNIILALTLPLSSSFQLLSQSHCQITKPVQSLDMRYETSANAAFSMEWLGNTGLLVLGEKSRIFMYLMRRIIQDFAFNTQTSGSYFKIRKEVNTSQAEFFSFSGSSKEPA